ncbi:MAG: hypothetical protein NTZ26_12995 [Candidatus Aminicenantes bacterium]|nr:hypothetical protein [Candidatus Aminicenantes bacterium]
MKHARFIVGLGLVAALASGAFAQTESKPAFGISFSGFIKTDLLYDSRQTVSLREGHYLLYPKAEALDKDGRDLNAASSFHMLSIQTRLQGKIAGPDAFGAKTSGLIEAEFFGTSDADINGFRLRHAFVKLSWKTTELMVGQYWHPLFVTESYPDVVSFNTGAPFQPFNRSPQIRLTQTLGHWSLQATALAQRDFVSFGPEGASSAYARNAVQPEFNLRLQYAWSCPAGCELLLGAAGDYLALRPRLVSGTGYAARDKVSDWAGMAYFKVRTKPATLKVEAFYGGNPYHLTMLGGYAVHDVTDTIRDLVDFTSFDVVSVWSDFSTNGTAFQAGMFVGWSKNLGAGESIGGAKYGRGLDIDALYRVAPRVLINSGKLRLAGEVEYTAAAYGTPGTTGKVGNADWVGNLRLLGAVYYFF